MGFMVAKKTYLFCCCSCWGYEENGVENKKDSNDNLEGAQKSSVEDKSPKVRVEDRVPKIGIEDGVPKVGMKNNMWCWKMSGINSVI